MRGTAPIITCDHEDGCPEWVIDYYSGLASNWAELMPGWQYEPYRDSMPHLCPEHASTVVSA